MFRYLTYLEENNYVAFRGTVFQLRQVKWILYLVLAQQWIHNSSL